MAERIPQATSYVLLFKAYLTTTGAEATGVTIALTASLNGGAFGALNAVTNATEISSGWYKVTLDTTDTGTLGPLAIRGTSATINDVGILLTVVSATTGGATNLDAAISSRMATYTQPTGFLAATFPSGTVANTTNITAGTITTVGAVTGAVGSVTGAVGSVAGNVVGSVGSVTGLTASNLDATVSSRLASASYTAPPTAAQNAAGLLDAAAGVETGLTVRQAFRLFAAALLGKASGLATTTAVYRDTNDTKDRITGTVDSSGNRTAVTLDAS